MRAQRAPPGASAPGRVCQRRRRALLCYLARYYCYYHNDHNDAPPASASLRRGPTGAAHLPPAPAHGGAANGPRAQMRQTWWRRAKPIRWPGRWATGSPGRGPLSVSRARIPHLRRAPAAAAAGKPPQAPPLLPPPPAPNTWPEFGWLIGPPMHVFAMLALTTHSIEINHLELLIVCAQKTRPEARPLARPDFI